MGHGLPAIQKPRLRQHERTDADRPDPPHPRLCGSEPGEEALIAEHGQAVVRARYEQCVDGIYINIVEPACDELNSTIEGDFASVR
jgi:hypothetical protein